MNRWIEAAALVWRAPLCLMSYLLSRLARWAVPKYVFWRRKKTMGGEDSLEWLGCSENLARPLTLPLLMVTAPRWNCEAVLGTAGPFRVQSGLAVQLEAARVSASIWLFEIKTGGRTAATLSSTTSADHQSWWNLELTPGSYRIILRYYQTADEILFPAVKIDCDHRVAERRMDDEPRHYRDFLETVRDRCGIGYYCLHYYIYHLLRRRAWFSEPVIAKEFLPAANSETNFLYGSLDRGEFLRFSIPQTNTVAQVSIVYLNRCSFPVFWENLTSLGTYNRRVPYAGVYLVRIHTKPEFFSDDINR